MAKRSYQRQSDDVRIEALERKIAALRERMQQKQRKDGPVLKELKKVQKVLRHFSLTAHENSRQDIGNMVDAFCAGLERQVELLPEEPRRRGRNADSAA